MLKLELSVGDQSVRWKYTVNNTKGNKPVPYGLPSTLSFSTKARAEIPI